MALRAGDRLGEWVVQDLLGEGGMGAVYLCHNALSSRMQAAVKVLKAGQVSEARERFVREIETMAQLRHEAVVRVMGGGEEHTHAVMYLVMEYVQGEPLDLRLQRGRLDAPEALSMVRALADGLRHAHALGIQHRDVKPANIILTAGGAKLIDFGIALSADRTRLTSDNHLPGTLAYIAPEAFTGVTPDPVSADVYALGLVLHECLTGGSAFSLSPQLSQGQQIASLMGQKLQSGPLDPGADTDPPMRELVRQTTEPDPRHRLPDMAAFVAAIDRIGTIGAGHRAPPPPLITPTRSSSQPTLDFGDLTAEPPPEAFASDDPPVDDDPSIPEWRPPSRSPLLPVALTGGVVIAGMLLWSAGREPPAPAPPQQEEKVAPPPPGPGSVLAAFDTKMITVRAGPSWMGSPADEPERSDNELRHPVVLTKDFALSATEVTQGLWAHVMGENPVERRTRFWNREARAPCADWGVGEKLPVMCVDWLEAVRFTNRLSELEGLTPAYQIAGSSVSWSRDADGYRLPTEAEWEYAARAGRPPSATADLCATANVANRATKDRHYAWLTWPVSDCDDGLLALAPVGSLQPDALGLYDIVGNVSEWVFDAPRAFTEGTVTDPVELGGPDSLRGLRGGGWHNRPSQLRLAARHFVDPANREMFVGLRLARTMR